MRPKVYIIDASNMIHRAFHAMGDLSTSYGFPTGAIWGTMKMMLKFIDENQPTHLIMAYDYQKGKSVRKDMFPAYKANRPQTTDVSAEEKILRHMFELLSISGIELEGYEADDVIASCVKSLKDTADIVVVTGDKDMLQLIGPNVSIFDSMKNVMYGHDEVSRKFGVDPDQISDYLAIVGDKTDNVPGVMGIGPKGAQVLLKSYRTVEEIYDSLPAIDIKLRTKLEQSRELAFLSKKLTVLFDELLPDLTLKHCEFKPKHSDELLRLFTKLEFGTTLKNQVHEVVDQYERSER